MNARYERGAMILTSNRGFAEWGEVFGDPVVAAALLDRLLHHATVVQIEGNSYRMRRHADRVPSRSDPSPQGRHRRRPMPRGDAHPARPPPAPACPAAQAPRQTAERQERGSNQRLITASAWGDFDRQVRGESSRR